jgi:hypothetical protein
MAIVISGTIASPACDSRDSGVIVIDSQVDDLNVLVAGLIKDGQRIVILDQATDGIEQITQVLGTIAHPLDALHIIGHGVPGSIALGSTELSLQTLPHYREHLNQWDVANVLIYGCNVAAGDAGSEFLDALHHLTQANISASTRKVGHRDRGGQWHLDVSLGTVTAPTVVTPTLQATYTGVMAGTIYTVTEDNTNNAGEVGVPDGDFGKGIRVGANFARNTNVDPNEELLIQPIEFYIETDIEATSTSYLFLSVFDVDLPNEIDRVSFNGAAVGDLEGQNGLTFKSVFPLSPALINLGNNLVQIDVDIVNEGGPNSNDWEAEILKAELLINYELGSSLGTAFIESIGVDPQDFSSGDMVDFTAEIDTTLAGSQTLVVEAILRDPNGNAVAFDDRSSSENFVITGTDKDAFTWSPTLPDDPQQGLWSIDISAFEAGPDDSGTGDFQFLETQLFAVGCGEPSDPSVFQFKQFVQFETLDEGRTYTGSDLFAEVGGLRIASLFDETFYLGEYQDIADAQANGGLLYGYDHFLNFGISEGRNPSFYYDEAFYLANNEDVNIAVANDEFSSGLEHYLNFGHIENRDPSTLFDADLYLQNNPDVDSSVNNGGFESGFDHYIEFGAMEGRINTLLYEEAFYLSTYPDVADNVNNGGFPTGFDHYISFGQGERRDPSSLFDESAYLDCYPDVAAAVTAGSFSSGMEHYFRFGRQEGRPSFLVPEAVI